jgi:hypothetical protein
MNTAPNLFAEFFDSDFQLFENQIDWTHDDNQNFRFTSSHDADTCAFSPENPDNADFLDFEVDQLDFNPESPGAISPLALDPEKPTFGPLVPPGSRTQQERIKWERMKPTIKDLYITQNWSLPEVKAHMEVNHQFFAT